MSLISKNLVKLSSPQLFKNGLNAMFLSTCSKSHESFKFEELEMDLRKTVPNLPDPSKLIFGHTFTDHMLTIKWNVKSGWGKPKIEPLKNLEIHPAAKVLHYSVEVFEGMKAYYGVDGKIRLFRPDLNMARLSKSSERSTLPAFDKEEFLKCLKKLVSVEKDWIPKSTTASLYIRPTFIGTEPTLGVNSSSSALLYILTSPTGPYFPTGFKPVNLLADAKYVRAFPGGVGNVKVGSNYGPTIYVSIEAQKKGCQQVLWLFDKEEYLTEAGTMNICVVIKNKNGETELVTPPLDGTILEGVTRQSILDLTRKWGDIKVTERPITMKETLKLLEKNQLVEAFGAGTACVVCPIESILYKDVKYKIPTMETGAKVMSRIAKELNDIQYGRVIHEWAPLVEDEWMSIKMNVTN
jgi:branched-chain amino acid aminotransferase